ncbi:MAG: GC-type dockerin domain-anchored protein [Planctomycetota bacterium]
MAALGTAAGALADSDPRYIIHVVVDRPVLEPGETATIELRAGFDSASDWAMSDVFLDLLLDTGGDAFDDFGVLRPMDAVGSDPGVPTGRGIEGIIAGQLQFHNIFADPTDPMAFWRGTYVAPSEPGVENVHTSTTQFQVYPCRDCVRPLSRMDVLIEEASVLRIVSCRADLDEDGSLTLFDFLAFANAFESGDALADFDFDGELTLLDFLEFQNRFDLGCPP